MMLLLSSGFAKYMYGNVEASQVCVGVGESPEGQEDIAYGG